MPARLRLAALAVVLAAVPAAAQTITVNTIDDLVDFGGLQRVAELPGADRLVSFREACIAANNTPGPQSIEFAIPSGGPGWNGGVVLLYMDFYVFELSDDETTVDFTTQTAFTGDTNPTGNEVGIQCSITAAGVPAIVVSGDRCVIEGLDRVSWAGYAVELAGSNNRVIGCTISGPLFAAVNVEGPFGGPIATGNVIGGTGPGEGNLLAGVSVLGATDGTVVIGNIVRGGGVRVEGATQYDFVCSNVRVGGPTPEERNILQGGGGIGEEGLPTGRKISVVDADNVIVQGNYIGTTQDGSAPYSQRAPAGVSLRNARNVVVRDNLIAGIAVTGSDHYAGQRFGNAVSVVGRCTNTLIYGNKIGTDATGAYGIPNLFGVVVSPLAFLDLPTGTVIGGVLPGQGNLIAFSEAAGVRIIGSAFGTDAGVRIRGNSIFSNGALGIDLLSSTGASGVSLNDPGDGDTGGNSLQNFPVIAAASGTATDTTIQGSLNSLANQTFTLDFFAAPACDPSGFGEGQRYLGSTTVSADASGNISFDVPLPTPVLVGWVVTATAMQNVTGNTSEFSACAPLSGGLCPADVNHDGFVDGIDYDQFNNAFEAGNMAADYDGDGFVDGIDSDQFNNDFEAGC